jgi:hypothetical protein
MEDWFIWIGIGLCLFSLWAVARYDWLRLTRPSRRVLARVTGHRESWENSSKSYAAIYSFSAEGGTHEVEDAVHSSYPLPEVGTLRELAYPDGHPGLARPPRPLLWLMIYAFLLALPALLFAHWMGWVA